MRRRAARRTLLRTATLALLACGSCAHSEAFEAGVLKKGDVHVRIGPVPPAWRRIQVDGADLAFRDDPAGGSALFNVRCGRSNEDSPLRALTEQLIMGTTDRNFLTQSVIPFDRREAMHTVLLAKLDGVPMEYEIFVMKKNGCVYDLVYVAPPDLFPMGASGFEQFALGLRAGPAPGADNAPAESMSDP